jgi:putative proteasome-type protease
MTYCVGLLLNDGFVLASDTRTNAGVDNVATFKKMHIWEWPAERVIALVAAGNLSITQSVISQLDENANAGSEQEETVRNVTTLFQAARLVGRTVGEVRNAVLSEGDQSSESFSVSFLLAGQIGNERPRLFQIYSEGNFIEATADTPFFQIGEHKYGKPILDRVVTPQMKLSQAVRVLMISFDSTIRSNLSVGLPIDLMVYRKDALSVELNRRIEVDDANFAEISAKWSDALRDAFAHLPDYRW